MRYRPLIIDKEIIEKMTEEGEEPQDYMTPIFKAVRDEGIIIIQDRVGLDKNLWVIHNNKCLLRRTWPASYLIKYVYSELHQDIRTFLRESKINKLLNDKQE
jgi:hypothetical protein